MMNELLNLGFKSIRQKIREQESDSKKKNKKNMSSTEDNNTWVKNVNKGLSKIYGG